jgi:hypothetical protein
MVALMAAASDLKSENGSVASTVGTMGLRTVGQMVAALAALKESQLAD